MARRGLKALQALKARWGPVDRPEKRANQVRLDPADLRDLPGLLAQRERRAMLGLPAPEERQVRQELHLKLCESSVELIRSPVERAKFWCRSFVPAVRATVLSALARAPVFAPESSCAYEASSVAGKRGLGMY